MSDPAVSVLLPVYNDMTSIAEALDSILQQTFDDYEIIVVDDGSTDGTEALLSQYSDNDLVRIVSHEKNLGLPAALNTGIDAAMGAFIARQDSDDRSLPERLAAQYQYLRENPTVALVATGVEVIDNKGKVNGSFVPPKNPAAKFHRANPIVHGSVMFRRDIIEQSGCYDEFFKHCQDYELWVRLSRSGAEIHRIPEMLYQLRREDGSMSVHDRKEYSLYAALARLPATEKQRLKEVARTEGLLAVQSHLSRNELANLNYRLTRAHIDHRKRIGAIRSAIQALRANPLALRTYAHLSLACVPMWASQFIINRLDGR
jgi:glycosyltransferase involved in cell wall biosynthesis